MRVTRSGIEAAELVSLPGYCSVQTAFSRLTGEAVASGHMTPSLGAWTETGSTTGGGTVG